MKLDLTMQYEVTETTPEVEKVLDEIVAEESREFVESVRRRFDELGIDDISVSMSETGR